MSWLLWADVVWYSSTSEQMINATWYTSTLALILFAFVLSVSLLLLLLLFVVVEIASSCCNKNWLQLFSPLRVSLVMVKTTADNVVF